MIKAIAMKAARTALLLALVVPGALTAATNPEDQADAGAPYSDEVSALTQALQAYDTAIDNQNRQEAANALDRIDEQIDKLAGSGEPLDEAVTAQVKRRIADARHALAGREWMQAQQAIVEATRAMRQSETGRHSTPEN